MTERDFERVKSIIKSVYPRIEYLDNPDAAALFFNMLSKYDFNDVWKGVKNCVEVERYAPVITVVEQYVKDAEKARKDDIRRASVPLRDAMTVKCTKCNDSGFLWIRYANGTETVRPCNCEKGREDSPWNFMTDAEYQAALDQQRKRGQNPPMDRPGHPTEWWIKECGDIVSISPGRRLPARKMER